MGIKIRTGETKNILAATIIHAAKGRTDPYGNRFEIIELKWNPAKRNFHQSRTLGCEDVEISRFPNGGISFEYKTPGSIEWIKDDVGGDFIGMICKTPTNMHFLACNYYDNLWSIVDPNVNLEIRAMADEIDERNKKINIQCKKQVKVLDGSGKGYVFVENEITMTQYEFDRERRKLNFTTTDNEPIRISQEKLDVMDFNENLRLLKKNEELKKIDEEIAAKKKEAMEKKEDLFKKGMRTTNYSEEFLCKLHPYTKLFPIAQEFGIDTKDMNKKDIIAAIMEKQNSNIIVADEPLQPEEVTNANEFVNK